MARGGRCLHRCLVCAAKCRQRSLRRFRFTRFHGDVDLIRRGCPARAGDADRGGVLDSVDPFLGTSAAIREVAEQVERVGVSHCPVLISGETGAGKGVLAKWVHDQSPRAEEAFVDLNCAGFGRELLETELFGHEPGAFTGAVQRKMGLLEVAQRGTVFLDEIGDMDLQIQPKLLKILEEKRFRRLGDVHERQLDVRLIAASHEDLAQLVRE